MRFTLLAAALAAALSGCASVAPPAPAKNVIFFLGDGLGINTLTAARIFAVGEAGQLTLDTLPESAFVKTFANDAQVTDSAAAMSAYMTGVKVNNGVISMSADTLAIAPDKDGASRCTTGKPVPTLGELARQRGLSVGVVTTTRVTDATPGAVYAHACERGMQADIAAALVPGGAGYNIALGANGIDVLFGGGLDAFRGKRADGRDLVAELGARGVRTALDTAQFMAIDRVPAIGLFAPGDTSYDALRDPAREPGLQQMASKAITLLSKNPKGFFLVVEGGLIDHALHDTQAKRALQETVVFDRTLKAVMDQMQGIDPGLKNTLIVLTADHDHTMQINGYPKRGNPITDIVRDYVTGEPRKDADGKTFTTLVFGNGPNHPDVRADVDSVVAQSDDYHQETGVHKSSETHGGGDVKLFATGAGSAPFKGTIENTRVFELMKAAAGL